MKRRNGFVSNSSSSSFIIGVKKEPQTFEESLEIFFGDKKDDVAINIQKGMYRELKKFPLDFKKMRELAEEKWGKYGYDDDDSTNEKTILNELKSDFEYNEKYHRTASGISYWSSAEKTEFDKWVEKEIEKRGIDKDNWNEKYKLQNEYFDQPKIKKEFLEVLDEFINDFKDFSVIMQGEFSDDYETGCDIEHNFAWDRYFTFRRFSHH